VNRAPATISGRNPAAEAGGETPPTETQLEETYYHRLNPPQGFAFQRVYTDDRSLDDVGVSVSYPLPGTEFHESVKDQLGTKTNWSDSDDLAMMFEGTYVGPFYKRVRDLLHEEAALWAPGDGLCAFDRHAKRTMLDEAWRALEADEPRHRSERPTRPSSRPAVPVLIDESPAAR